MFYWQEDPSTIQQARKSDKWLKVQIIAVKGPMAVIGTSATTFQTNVSKLRRKPFGNVDLENLLDSREWAGAPVLWLSCEGQIDVWELFCETLIWAPSLLGKDFWLQLQEALEQRRPRVSRHSCCNAFGPNSRKRTPKSFMHEEVVWQQYHLCLVVAEHQILGGQHFLILGPESGKIWRLKKVQLLQKKYHCQWTLLRGMNPEWFFHNLGNMLRPLKFGTSLAWASGSRGMASPHSPWSLHIKSKSDPVREPQYRQCALLSDFLDLAHLSFREEAALATN